MAEQTILDLGRMVKAKHADYADLDDEEVGRRVKAKFPQDYADFADIPSKPDIPGYGQPAYSNPPAPPMVASDTDLKRQGLAKNAFGDISDVGGGSFADQAGRQKHVWTESVPFLDTAAAIANKRPMAAAHRGLGDAMSVAAPFAAAPMAAAPLRSLLRIGAGGAAAQGTHAIANEMDLPPDAADLASDAAGLIVGGPMGSRAFTGRAKALGQALPELLPSRFRTKYNAVAGALRTPAAPAPPSAPVDPNSISSYARSLGLPEATPLEGPPTSGTVQAAPSWPPRGPLPAPLALAEESTAAPQALQRPMTPPNRPQQPPALWPPQSRPLPAPIPGSPISGGGTTSPQAMIAPPRQQMPPPVGPQQIGAPMPPQASQLPPEVAPPQAQAPPPALPATVQATGKRTTPYKQQGAVPPQSRADVFDTAVSASKALHSAGLTAEELAAMQPGDLSMTPEVFAEAVNQLRRLEAARGPSMGINQIQGRPTFDPVTRQVIRQ